MANRWDLLLLGATGFTGMHCIPYIHKLSTANGRNLTWAVAGRSEEKLGQVLDKVGKEIDADLRTVPIVVVDIYNDGSLLRMAQRAKVVINCCGPFYDLGEPVVKACIAAGTHHVDITGEMEFMEKVQLEQNEAAKEKGVYVVSACGLDSIPGDLGVAFLQQEFQGTLNSAVTYLEGWQEDGATGSMLNYGTWHTVVKAIGHMNELKELRRKLFPNKLPKFKPELKLKNMPHKPNVVNGWAVPFPGADLSVIQRSQRYFYETEDKRPVQANTYFLVKTFWGLIKLGILGTILSTFGIFGCGRKLLLKYPGFFSFGYFNKNPPSEEAIEKTWFQITFYGEGWQEKRPHKDEHYTTPCDRCIVGRVKGRNPAYGATAAMVVLSAIMILTEKEKLPGGGGVLSPAAAFARTSLIKQLNENGVTFDILSQKDL